MPNKIHVNFDLCESNAVCMALAPAVFDVDDRGYLNLLTEDVTPENAAEVEEAITQCPRQAISLKPA